MSEWNIEKVKELSGVTQSTPEGTEQKILSIGIAIMPEGAKVFIYLWLEIK
jgi:hypothetical protein